MTPSHVPNTPPITIVLVDDDSGHLELLRRIVRRAGFHCTIVTLRSGSEALDYLLARGAWTERAPFGPTVLLIDLQMPGGPDGLEVLATLRTLPDAQRIAAILHTGRDEPDDAARAEALGCVALLAKPADHATIVATLTRAIVHLQ